MTKHAVLGKFNEIRPGVYREFMKVRLTHTPSLRLRTSVPTFCPMEDLQAPVAQS